MTRRLGQCACLLLLISTNVQAFAPPEQRVASSLGSSVSTDDHPRHRGTSSSSTTTTTTSYYLPPNHWYENTDIPNCAIFPDHDYMTTAQLHHHARERRSEAIRNGMTENEQQQRRRRRRMQSSSRPVDGDHHEPEERARVVAAGVGTGVLGLLVCGPVGATVLGFSAAFAAETNDKVVGDSARAVGDLALSARAKATEIDRKHHVVQRTVVGATEAWEKAKELDRQHKIVQKAKDLAIYSSTATVDFVRRHNLIERGARGIGKGVGWLNERIVAGTLSPADDTHDEGISSPSSSSSSSERNAYRGVSQF